MHGDLRAVFEDLPPSCYVENGTSHFPQFVWVAVVTPTCALQLLRMSLQHIFYKDDSDGQPGSNKIL